MRPQSSAFAVESNLSGEAVKMQIHDAAMQHIMDVLTDLYADREMAALREYATNAWDSHVEAGVTDPIEVELPTELRPFLTICDHGLGLSAQDVRAIYSQYGASTKRTTDAVAGMLGLGCKAALAYADQFTLVATKDGRRITVSVSRDDEGAGGMTILEDTETDEPNGVAVQIPARRDNEFAEKAERLFAFWEAGTVLVDGEVPTRLTEYVLTDELSIVDKAEADGYRAWFVMGNVPYPADEFFDLTDATLNYNKALIARVPIGSLEFPPSRESLKDTPLTRETFARVEEEFTEAKAAAVQRDVDNAATRGEAIAAYVTACEALGNDPEVTWRGEELPAQFEAFEVVSGAQTADREADRWWYLPDTSRYHRASRSAHSRERTLSLKVASRAVWVLGFSNGTWTKPMRDKLDRYVAYHGHVEPTETVEYVLTRAEELPSEWLEECRTLRWADIREWKDPDRPKGGGGTGEAYAGTYGCWITGGWHKRYPAEDLRDHEGPLYYIVGEAGDWPDGGLLEEVVRIGDSDAILAVLPQPRLAKFQRLFPDAEDAQNAAQTIGQAWYSRLTQRQRDAIATWGNASWWSRQTLGFDVTKADDPDIQRWELTRRSWTQELHNQWSRLGTYVPTASRTGQALVRPHEKYPLLNTSGAGGKVPEHLLLYVNAAYAAQREEY